MATYSYSMGATGYIGVVSTPVYSCTFDKTMNKDDNQCKLRLANPADNGAAYVPAAGDAVGIFLTESTWGGSDLMEFAGTILTVDPQPAYYDIVATSHSLGKDFFFAAAYNNQAQSDILSTATFNVAAGNDVTINSFDARDKSTYDIIQRLNEIKASGKIQHVYNTNYIGIVIEDFGYRDSGKTLSYGTGLIKKVKWDDTGDEMVDTVVVNYNGGSVSATTGAAAKQVTLYRREYSVAADAQKVADSILDFYDVVIQRCVVQTDFDILFPSTYASTFNPINTQYTIDDPLTGKSVKLTLTKYKVDAITNMAECTFASVWNDGCSYIPSVGQRVAELESLYVNTTSDTTLLQNAATNTLRHSHDAEATTLSNTYAKLKTITFANGLRGGFRVKFDYRQTDGTGTTAIARIYKNGVAVGTEAGKTSTAYSTVSEDFTISLGAGDTLELWAKTATGSTPSCKVQNFRVYYDPVTTPTSANT